VVNDTSTGTATSAAHCGLMIRGAKSRSWSQLKHARWTQEFLRGSGHLSVTPYIHGGCIAMCVFQARVELAQKRLV
jgi:hypothetical protein